VFRALIASDVRIADSTVARSEDDTTAVVAALADQDIGTGDVVIGVAASGTTPFVLAGLRYAKAAGAWTAGLACNDGTPLLQEADEPILLATGPEIVAGSTRLKAGTAQKVALNRISTVAMVLSGRVTSNVMTELTGSVDKLRSRAVRIVADLGDVPVDVACRALESTDWRVRPALEFVWSSDSPDSTP
jgi:N-acetylmuramic acid 6-phosphate etherase